MGAPESGSLPLPATDVEAWAAVFTLLGDTTRLRLLMAMHHRPSQTVTELAGAAAIHRDTASQALKVLREQGWVNAERDGRQMRYTLVDVTTHRVLHFMGQRHDGQHQH